jgi:hypothetical protein
MGFAHGEIEAFDFGKATHRRSDFTRAKRGFHPPARVDLTKKRRHAKSVSSLFSGGVTQI